METSSQNKVVMDLAGRALSVESSPLNPNYFLSPFFVMLVFSIIAINRTLALVRPRRPQRRRTITGVRIVLRLWVTIYLSSTAQRLATLLMYNNTDWFQPHTPENDAHFGPGSPLGERAMWDFYKLLCFSTFFDVFSECLANGRPSQETPNLFELSMTLHYAAHSPSYPQLVVIVFFECCKLLATNLLLVLTDQSNKMKLVPTAVFGISNLLHFAWCLSHGKPYPLLPFLSRVPESIVVLVILTVLVLQFVMNLINEQQSRHVFDTMRWSWNEDFSTVLFRCGQLCMETTAHSGMANELETLQMNTVSVDARRQSVRKSPFSKLLEGAEAANDKITLQQQSALRWWTLLCSAGFQRVKIAFGKWFPRLVSPPSNPAVFEDDEDDEEYIVSESESDSDCSESDGSDSMDSEEAEEQDDLYREIFDLTQDVPEAGEDDFLASLLRQRATTHLQDRRVCVVCASEPRNIVLRPCMCLVLCDECRSQLALRGSSICPTCRRKVVGYSKIYEP
jgi:hypothetical protein